MLLTFEPKLGRIYQSLSNDHTPHILRLLLLAGQYLSTNSECHSVAVVYQDQTGGPLALVRPALQ